MHDGRSQIAPMQDKVGSRERETRDSHSPLPEETGPYHVEQRFE